MEKLGIFIGSLMRGGAERVSVHLADYMQSHGVSTTLFTLNFAKNEYPLPEGVVRMDMGRKLHKYLSYPIDVVKLRRAIRKSGIDTLLIMDTPGCLEAIPATWGLNVKVVVSERNDPYHFGGKQIVADVSRKLMKNADGFVFQTQGAKKFYDELYGRERGTVISNPLICDTIPAPWDGERKKMVVNAARLNPQKNQKLLISAFAKFHQTHPDYTMLLYGEGNLRERLQQQIDVLGLHDAVQMPGNVSDIFSAIRDAGMFVMSSDFEGIPNALLEAMAIGLPCISTDCPPGGPRSVISHGENGLLTPVGDAEALATQMCTLADNPELAQKLGNEAMKIKDKLDSNVICQQWLEYFQGL